MNDSGTSGSICAETEPENPATMRSNLMAQRAAAGAESAIGHHCSNLIELLQLPELPTHLIRRQLDGLDRLTAQLN